jgi:3-mercaptopyruvate sulfurtransferase SseA
MNEPSLPLSRLDYITRMLSDNQKTIFYNKGSGVWWWINRIDHDQQDVLNGPFNTWLDAAINALELE